MQTRNLGHSTLQVVPLMLGGNVFGWTTDAATSFTILDAFTDAGFNFIDTADVYSRWKPGNHGGESEHILGQWFARSGKRDKVILATKVGQDMGDGKKGLTRKHILEGADASLHRLQTDYIDLYQSHIDDPSTPIDETLEAYQILIQQGKIRLIGASNFSAKRTRESIDIAKRNHLPAYQTIQPEYNLHQRQFENELQPVAKELALGVLPYFALASGFLTGKYKSKADTKGANRESRVARYFDTRGMKILDALDEVSRETGAAPATIALAWLLAQPTVLAPVASASSTKQLDALLAAPALKLDQVELDKLTRASAY
jgi:aryl-alcohol dehydrogenase-like predicted oxidoreductase